MNVTDLRERIAEWENLHTEFKEWPVQADDLAASLVAFANTDGGQLLLGVAKDRTIPGVRDPDAAARQVDNVSLNNCEPPITVIQEFLLAATEEIPGTVVVVNVPKGTMRPYRTNRGVHYIRTTSGRRAASREELLRLFQSAESLFYDETPLTRLSISDLDLEAFGRYVDETASDLSDAQHDRLLRNWGLVSNGYPTLAGMLLFGREPQRHVPFAQINAARFPGTDSSVEPADRKEIRGRLLDLVTQAESFLNLHLFTPHTIQGFEPEARPELPKVALREAIVNAVAHRDYTIHAPVRLFIFDDRVEIHTPGKPPNTVDEETMRAGVHVVRNPRIYARLSDAGLVTGAGTGIRRIVRLVREAVQAEVEIRIQDYEVLLTIPRRQGGP